MPAFLVPLHEFNTCHVPTGPRGGEFCAATATAVEPKGRESPASPWAIGLVRSDGTVVHRYFANHASFMQSQHKDIWPDAELGHPGARFVWRDYGPKGTALNFTEAPTREIYFRVLDWAAGQGLTPTRVKFGLRSAEPVDAVDPRKLRESSRLIPLHEFNPCHTPSGPQGGQFCATRDAFVPAPPRKPLPFTRRTVVADEANLHRIYMTPSERREWDGLQARATAITAEWYKEKSWIRPRPGAHPVVGELGEKWAAVAQQMAVVEEQAARRTIREIATELDFDPARITIVKDAKPREFEVGGRQWQEAGHFSPTTGRIQVNLHNSSGGVGLVKLVVHEVAHAKYEVWRSAMGRESADLRDWKPPGSELTRNQSPYNAAGYVRPEFRAAFRRQFPAHAAAEDTWGHGYSEQSLMQQMMKDDGFTGYSRAYWADARKPGSYFTYKSHTGQQITGGALSRAMDETLSEVAAWRVGRRMLGRSLLVTPGSEPSASWRKFSARINQFYRAHKSEYGG